MEDTIQYKDKKTNRRITLDGLPWTVSNGIINTEDSHLLPYSVNLMVILISQMILCTSSLHMEQ
jgi:hypothetical protein